MAGRRKEENSSFSVSEWDHRRRYCCLSTTCCWYLSSCRLVVKPRGREGEQGSLWTRLPTSCSAFSVSSWQFFAYIFHSMRSQPFFFFWSVPIFLHLFLPWECDLTQKCNKCTIASFISLISSLQCSFPTPACCLPVYMAGWMSQAGITVKKHFLKRWWIAWCWTH